MATRVYEFICEKTRIFLSHFRNFFYRFFESCDNIMNSLRLQRYFGFPYELLRFYEHSQSLNVSSIRQIVKKL